jgi:hypothetical protein
MWKARNLLIFQSKKIPAMEFIHQALQGIHDYQHQQKHNLESDNQASKQHNNSNERWTPPPNTAWKINVDAHSLDDGKWGIRWIVRKYDGDWVEATTRFVEGIEEAIEAEAREILEVVEDLHRFTHGDVIIESDNNTVVTTIQSQRYPRS